MYKHSLAIWLLIIATFHFGTFHAGRTSGTGRTNFGSGTGYGRRGGMYGGMYGAGEQPQTQPPSQTPKEYLDNKSGFSTFGIISIIFVVIVCCLVFYYGIMCYPILCGEEKKYRFMDVSSTITSATSRSMQSMEILPEDQKH